MSLVLDPSLALSWFFEDERTAAGDALLARITQEGAEVPELWRLEIANGLQVGIRRKRIDAAYRDRALAELRRMPIAVDRDGEASAWTITLTLADRCRLTLYDAAYLELAQRRGLKLATLDAALQAAAEMVGVETCS